MGRMVAIAGLLILAAFNTGCADTSPSQPPELREFTAEYSLSTGEVLNLKLRGATSILDANGDRVDTYELLVERSKDGEKTFGPSRFFLDGSLRVLRVEARCFNSFEGECIQSLADWQVRGTLAPYGIGLPLVATSSGKLQVQYFTSPGSVDIAVSDGGARYVVKDESTAVSKWYTAAGTFRFALGEIVPTHFVRPDDENLEGSRTSLTLGERLEGAVAAAPLPIPSPRPRSGPLFEGADDDLFGRGYTPSGGWRFLVENSADARRLMEKGCVTAYIESERGGTSIAGMVNSTTWLLRYHLQSETEAKWLHVTFSRDILEAGYSLAGEEEGHIQLPCHELNASPWPELSASSFIGQTNARSIPHNGIVYFQWDLGLPSAARPPASAGLDHYRLGFAPSTFEGSGTFMPLWLEASASGAGYLGALLEPAALASLDGRF